MLPVQARVVLSHISNQFTIQVWWITLPFSSRSILVTVLLGLIHDTKAAIVYSVKFPLRKMGCTDVKLVVCLSGLGCNCMT